MNWLRRHVRPEQLRELSLLALIIVADTDLRFVDRQLLFLSHVQSHRLERRDHHGGRGRPDARRADAQHRSVGGFDRRLHRLFRRDADRQPQRHQPAARRGDFDRLGAALGVVNGVLVAWGTRPRRRRDAGHARDLSRRAGRSVGRQDRDDRQPAAMAGRSADRLNVVPIRRPRHPRAVRHRSS